MKLGHLGLLATLAWLAAAGFFVHHRMGLEVLQFLAFQDLSLLLLAVFTPLAFLWLVLGYFQHGRALAAAGQRLEQLSAEMRDASQRADEQSKVILDNALSVRGAGFSRYLDLRIGDQIDKSIEIAEAIATSGATDEAKRALQKAIVQARQHYLLGRKQVFCVLIANSLKQLDRKTTSARLMEATPAMANYCTTYEDLLIEANDQEESGKVLEYLQRCSLGDAYLAICQFTNRKPYFEKPAATTVPDLTAM